MKKDTKAVENMLPEGFDARDYQDERAISLGGDMAVWKPSLPVPVRGYVIARVDHGERITSRGEVMPPWSQIVVRLTKPTMAFVGGSDDATRVEAGEKVLVAIKHGIAQLGPAATNPTLAVEVILSGKEKIKIDGMREVWRWDLKVLPEIRRKEDVAPEYAIINRLKAAFEGSEAPALPQAGADS